MIRNLVIILVGVIPASFLSLFAIGLAAIGVGRIGNGYLAGWVDLAIGAFWVLGTAALFGSVLFSMNIVTRIGLVLGCLAAVGALTLSVELDEKSAAPQALILLPSAVALYLLSEGWLVGRKRT